jgi:hypothetical protein
MTPTEMRLIEIQGFFQGALNAFEEMGSSENVAFAQALKLTEKGYSKEILYRSAFELFDQQISKLINELK